MNLKNQFFKSNCYCKSCFNPIYFVLFAVIMLSCSQREEPIKIVEFKGVEEVVNYSKTAITFKSDSINPTLLMYCTDDVFSVRDYAVIADIKSEDNTYNIQSDDRILSVNGRIYGISIPDSSQMLSWFSNMGDKDLSELQFLYFKSVIPEVYYPYLEEIAKIKPEISISTEQNLNEMKRLLNMFKPKCLIISELSEKDFGVLAGLTNLEILWMSLNDSVINEPLPALPKLKQVVLNSGPDENRILPNDLFTNNKQIEKVVFQFFDEFDMKILSSINNLKELVGFSDTIKNLDEINQHQSLEVLSIIGNANNYDPSEFKLPNIRWMTFYENVSQDAFDRFVVNHPKLEVVELIENNEITNYSKLVNLKKLFGLTITDGEVDMKAIENLKKLKYLSLPAEFLDESSNRALVQKTLPGVKITANNGYLCLGSGWLLLLIPLIIVFKILMRKKPVNHSF